MKSRLIPLEEYPRAEHFRYFSSLVYPFFSITLSLDITDFCAARKRWDDSFFLPFLYCVGRAANEVEPFRQRIQNGQIVEYEHCISSYTLLLKDHRYAYAEADTEYPFGIYLQKAAEARKRAEESQKLEDESDPACLFFISCMPYLSFTSLVCPVEGPQDSTPRFCWGKAFEQNGRILLPFQVQAHHALMDGWHVNLLAEGIERKLKSYVKDRFGTRASALSCEEIRL